MRTPASTPAYHRPHSHEITPLAVGIDSLYVGYYLDGVGIDWETLRFEKERLRETPGAQYAEIRLGGESFALHRGAQKPYSFTLSNKAFLLRLGERMRPLCYAQFSSELLWSAGLERALERLDQLWRVLGLTPTHSPTVSRVDAAFDFDIGKPDFSTGDFLSRAAKDCTWREYRTLQTIQFGTGDVVCRVYDKVAEIEEQSSKFWFYDIWGTRGGVWRCEFQVRGERLKEAGISTLDQMRAYLPSLVRHLAKHHTSLRVAGADSNRARWPYHPMRRGLVASVDQLLVPPDTPPPPLLTGAEYQLESQLRSLLGYLKGIAATLSQTRRYGEPMTLDDTLVQVRRLTGLRHSPGLWRADVLEKIRKRELGL